MYILFQPKISVKKLHNVNPHKECSYCSKVLNLHCPLYVVSSENYVQFRCKYNRVSFVVCFLLGNSPTSEFYMPTFWNTLF